MFLECALHMRTTALSDGPRPSDSNAVHTVSRQEVDLHPSERVPQMGVREVKWADEVFIHSV